MKRFLLFGLHFLTLSTFALASTDVGVAVYLTHAETVYLTKVASVKNNQVTFSITETLRGKSRPPLVLTPELGYDFNENTEWILISMPPGGKKDGVGGVMFGWSDWYPAAVIRHGEKVTIARLGSLEQARYLLMQNPYKP